MKSAISPADARLLSQKLWFLTQQRVDLLSTIAQNKSDAEEKVDLIPAFDNRLVRRTLCLTDLNNGLIECVFNIIIFERSFTDVKIGYCGLKACKRNSSERNILRLMTIQNG